MTSTERNVHWGMDWECIDEYFGLDWIGYFFAFYKSQVERIVVASGWQSGRLRRVKLRPGNEACEAFDQCQ